MSNQSFTSFEKFFTSLITRDMDDYTNKELAPLSYLTEKDSKWILEIDLPFVNKKDIEITIADNQLIVTAKLEKTYCVSKRDCIIEFNYFRKATLLPMGIDKEKISAKFNNGILSVNMPKISVGINIKID
ncbi:MAG: Hsp20/alpha crystallin family protein [Nitrosopumilaceae archaeon]